MPFGAEVMEDGAVRFRLWAPAARSVDLCLVDYGAKTALPMQRHEHGWYETITDRATAGSLYNYVINDDWHVPDPASRSQPQDVHGPSRVIDPADRDWQDVDWRGRPWREAIIYEIHTGSFSPQGDFQGISARLDYLQALGVTAIELMPVADFPGRHNWGYDGVLPFAPDHRYGGPEALKGLIESAHARGLMVLLDVVYNHFGPEGNYLHVYAPDFFTDRHHTPWGNAINFDGPHSRTVRDFFIHNALYWLEEFHIDGLRLDAVHSIKDTSMPTVLDELARAVRSGPGKERHVHLILENDNNESHYLRRDVNDDSTYDAQWNDDMHHAMHVLLTGERHGYYQDYADNPLQHLGRALTEGFSCQGETSVYRHGRPRGTISTHLPPEAFIGFLQNHDQTGNRAAGERIDMLAAPDAVRAMTSLLLLAPSVPLLFMGQEWGSARPFPYFCDYSGTLAEDISAGRRREFSRFPGFSQTRIPDPNDPSTFEQARLDWGSIGHASHRERLQFCQELLALRQRVIIPHLPAITAGHNRFKLFSEHALTVLWPLRTGGELRLYANLQNGRHRFEPVPLNNILYTTHPPSGHRQTDEWPPWFVMWTFDE